MRNQNPTKSAEEWKGDYLSGNGDVGGEGGRFEEVGSP